MHNENSDILPATLNDRVTALRQAAHPFETWQPEPGDQLLGEIDKFLFGMNRVNATAAWLTAWLKENMRVQGGRRSWRPDCIDVPW